MGLRSTLATASASAARWGLRSVLHRNGGVLPGRIALKLDPELLSALAGLVDASAVVTGTNGKTTTTNLIADAVAADGTDVVCNRAGNNMEPGIVGALLEARDGLSRAGKAGRRRVGVFECDELYTVLVLPKLRPDCLVLLNLFRDQLDRYGEIDHTQDVIVAALEASPGTTLLYNADDPLCAAIADHVGNRSVPFGIEGATGTESDRISDSRFCPRCNAPLSYDYVQYGQLGAYRCPSCGWGRPALARSIEHVELRCGGSYAFDLVEASVRATTAEATATGASDGKAGRSDARLAGRTHVSTSYNGLYMVYNVAAAFFAATALGADTDRFQATLDAYVPEGGRMATWQVAGRGVVSNLAKNPVGFDRQIQGIKTAGGRLGAFYLNDNDADGHDVSWIWDVEFERLAGVPGFTAFAGGTRAHDMQVRLKYAGIPAIIVDGIAPAIEAVAGEPADERLYAVANYTAFPPLVAELKGLQASDGTSGTATAADSTANGRSPAMGSSASSHLPAAPDPLPLDRPLRIVHLYPDALNLYGDGGNVIALERRCAWRGIPAQVVEVHMGDELHLDVADVVLMGGGSDRDQLSVAHELLRQRGEVCRYVEGGGALLAICGSYQLLGRSYYMGDERLEGLGAIDAETVRGEGRLIGNVAVRTELADKPFVGFENHGGRTRLGAGEVPLGRSVVIGTGNDGEDGTEGVLHRNLVGTYLHGPVLPKNPELADWLLSRALERRAAAGDQQAAALLPLVPLDDTCEHEAHDAAMGLLKRR